MYNYSKLEINNNVEEFKKFFNEIVYKSDIPMTYSGLEMNSFIKDFKDNKLKTKGLMCMPVEYQAGINNLGVAILYHLINNYDDGKHLLERAYLPEERIYKYLVKNNFPVMFSVESKMPAIYYDWIGFSCYFELQFYNIIAMLYRSGIPIYAEERVNVPNEREIPLVILGGVAAYSSEPIAPVVDAVFIGDGEAQLPKFVDLLYEYKIGAIKTKEELLLRMTNEIPGCYVPMFYEFIFEPIKEGESKEDYIVYDDNDYGKPGLYIKGIKVKDRYKGKVPTKITKAVIDINKQDPMYKQLTPLMDGNLLGYANIEISRGCYNSCRFCMASHIHKPYREYSIDKLENACLNAVKYLGCSSITPYSFNYSAYSQRNLLGKIFTEKLNKTATTSTQRVDTFSPLLSEAWARTGNKGATFAIEAGSQRMRNVINKEITEEQILNAAKTIIDQGYTRLKIYMISCLPFETEEDKWAIVDLIKKIVDYKKEKNSNLQIRISYTKFNAKPFTPLQWADVTAETDGLDEVYNALVNLGVKYRKSINDINNRLLQLLNRIDRRFCDIMVEMVTKYDTLYISGGIARKYDVEEYLNRKLKETIGYEMIEWFKEIPLDAILPWDLLSTGMSKEYLKQEYIKAKNAEVTPSCSKQCSKCGVCFDKDINKQGIKYFNYSKNQDISEQELYNSIVNYRDPQVIRKLLIEIEVNPEFRWLVQSKQKFYIKAALERCGLKVSDVISMLTDINQFDNYTYGKDLVFVRVLEGSRFKNKEYDSLKKALRVPKLFDNSLIDILNKELYTNLKLAKVVSIKEININDDIDNFREYVDYILYEGYFPLEIVNNFNTKETDDILFGEDIESTVPFDAELHEELFEDLSESIKEIEDVTIENKKDVNFDSASIVVMNNLKLKMKQKERGRSAGHVIYQEIEADIPFIVIKKADDNIIKVNVLADPDISIYDMLSAFFNVKKRELFRVPVVRKYLIKAVNKPSLFAKKCRICDKIVEVDYLQKPISDLCIECQAKL